MVLHSFYRKRCGLDVRATHRAGMGSCRSGGSRESGLRTCESRRCSLLRACRRSFYEASVVNPLRFSVFTPERGQGVVRLVQGRRSGHTGPTTLQDRLSVLFDIVSSSRLPTVLRSIVLRTSSMQGPLVDSSRERTEPVTTFYPYRAPSGCGDLKLHTPAGGSPTNRVRCPFYKVGAFMHPGAPRATAKPSSTCARTHRPFHWACVADFPPSSSIVLHASIVPPHALAGLSRAPVGTSPVCR